MFNIIVFVLIIEACVTGPLFLRFYPEPNTTLNRGSAQPEVVDDFASGLACIDGRPSLDGVVTIDLGAAAITAVSSDCVTTDLGTAPLSGASDVIVGSSTEGHPILEVERLSLVTEFKAKWNWLKAKVFGRRTRIKQGQSHALRLKHNEDFYRLYVFLFILPVKT